MTLAPIVLFVYNRLWHTQQTVAALQKNELAAESELFIYSDGPKHRRDEEQVKAVREYIRTVNGFKRVTVIERDRNFGLAENIIDGVTAVVHQYGRIIVLEDDIVTSACFLTFMNQALNLYEHDENVASIHGYIYPIAGLPDTFFIRGADCWGWGTWQRAWDIFEADGAKLLITLKQRGLSHAADFNGCYGYTRMLKDQIAGRNYSWAVRWYMSAFLKGMLTLYPGKSLVQNIGTDCSGTHCGQTDQFHVGLHEQPVLYKIDIREDQLSKNKIADFLKSTQRNFFQKIISQIKQVFL